MSTPDGNLVKGNNMDACLFDSTFETIMLLVLVVPLGIVLWSAAVWLVIYVVGEIREMISKWTIR